VDKVFCVSLSIKQREIDMKNQVSFKKVKSGQYKLLLNGAELITISKGTYNWYVCNETDAFTDFYNKLDRYHNWMVESQSYDTKAELKECFQFAANSIS